MDVFRRREIKFLLDQKQRQIVEQAILSHMVPDIHGVSTVCNLYYDTPDYRIIRHSLSRPVYKEKLRLRSYGRAQGNADVFLELKKKYKGIVYKRRVKVTEAEAKAFMEREGTLRKNNQICRELTYTRDFYPDLQPRVYLCYDRQAWYDPEDHGFRMTMDRNVRFRRDGLSLALGYEGTQLLREDQSLLEVKAEGAVPMWLVELLNAQRIYKHSFSKYGTAYQRMLAERTIYTGG